MPSFEVVGLWCQSKEVNFFIQIMAIQPNDKLITVVKVMLYLSLLVGGLLFVQGPIGDYMEGSTSYMETEVPVAPDDIPTFTTCFKRILPSKPAAHVY